MTFFVFEEQKSEAQRCHGCVGDVNNRRERAEMLNVVARQDLWLLIAAGGGAPTPTGYIDRRDGKASWPARTWLALKSGSGGDANSACQIGSVYIHFYETCQYTYLHACL